MSGVPPGYRAVLPEDRPAPEDLKEQLAFEALSRESLAATQKSAEAWRNGLTGLLALVTTGAVLTGRDATAHLTTPWRVAATVLIGSGIALTIAGLWEALAAQAGTRSGKMSLEAIRTQYGSITAYRVRLADSSARRLARARIAVATALGTLLLGLVTTWWAPLAHESPPAYLQVTTSTGSVCGELRSADAGVVRLSIHGRHDLATIQLDAVGNLEVVARCR